MWKRLLVAALAASLLATPALAGSRHRHKHHGHKYRGHKHHVHRYYGHGHPGYAIRHAYRKPYRYGYRHGYGYGYRYAPRYYRGYGHPIHVDDNVFLWLGLTAIGLKALDVFSYQQQLRFEQAHWQAARVPIGQSITWVEGGVSGAVTPVRDGFDAQGQYCREFQQEVRIGGRTERAFGTACYQPDGAWRITH